jgi:hypothetical protein
MFYFQPLTRSNDRILFSLSTVKQKVPFIPVGSINDRKLIEGTFTLSPVVAVTIAVVTVVRYKLSHSKYDSLSVNK